MSGDGAAQSGGNSFWTGEIDYPLPEDLIAQTPADRRERSRLMVVDRSRPDFVHTHFADLLRVLPEGALLVANDSKVFRARLHGHKRGSGGAVEALLLATGASSVGTAMIRVAKPLRDGQVVDFGDGVAARVVGLPVHGRATFDFAPLSVDEAVERCGELPLPPYITRESGPTEEDATRYQTVYAGNPGSVAAPTAGLHFTEELLSALAANGFGFEKITLHVGPGTFTPVRGSLSTHAMEEEAFEIGANVAARISEARSAGRPVVAVGTTTVRALESAARGRGEVAIGPGRTSLFIRPGFRFQVVDALITNLHLPGSTLLALVMALAGEDRIRRAYEAAVRERYRFYSYGDAMLIR